MGSRLTPHKNQGDDARSFQKDSSFHPKPNTTKQQSADAPRRRVQVKAAAKQGPAACLPAGLGPSPFTLKLVPSNQASMATLFPFLLLPLLLMVKHTSNFRPWIASLSSGSSRTILQVISSVPLKYILCVPSVCCPLSLCISPPSKSSFDPTSSSVLNFH